MPFLALIPVKDWIYLGVIAAIFAGGIYIHHKLITEGIAEQRAADDKASATLVADTAKQTAALQVKASMAEQAFNKEHDDNQTFRDSHPLQPVRLCRASNVGNALLPSTGATHSGNESAGAAAANVSNMPAGNSSGGTSATGPDISNLLGLLAVRADNVSAELREYQSR
jgi:hypothetical protein